MILKEVYLNEMESKYLIVDFDQIKILPAMYRLTDRKQWRYEYGTKI